MTEPREFPPVSYTRNVKLSTLQLGANIKYICRGKLNLELGELGFCLGMLVCNNE